MVRLLVGVIATEEPVGKIIYAFDAVVVILLRSGPREVRV